MVQEPIQEKDDEVKRYWYEFWPKEVPKHIDYKIRALGELLKNSAKQFPDSQAIYFEGFRMTYQELDILVDQFATGLSKLGVKKGDVVAIDTPNIPQFIIAFYAIQRIGAIVNPIIPLNRFVEIVYQVNDSNSKIDLFVKSMTDCHEFGFISNCRIFK